jgi:hypothetical protein
VTGNNFSGILPTIKLEPQLRHLYLSPSDRPGVSQVISHMGHVVKGRLELRLSEIEFSVCIAEPILRNEAQLETRTIT